MASSQDPRNGVYYGWGDGESGWRLEMDANLKLLGLIAGGITVLDRNLTDPPGSPSDGDAYIPAATATGDWAGHEDKVVIWYDSTWNIFTPVTGWLCYIQDEAVLSGYYGGSWSAGVALE